MTGSCVFPFSPFPKLVWNQWASPVSCHLLFSSPSILLLSFPLSHFSPYFSRQLSASCHCSRTMQVQVPFWVCVCARVCVCYCKWHSDIPATTGWMCGPSTLCLFRPLLYTFWEGGGQSMCACVRACVCVSRDISDTRLIITQTALPPQGQDGGYFRARVCVSPP